MGKKKEKYVELPELGVILWIPEDTVELTLKCKVMQDGKLVKYTKTLSNREIFEAHQEWEDKCETFVITEEGREYLKSLKEDSKSIT